MPTAFTKITSSFSPGLNSHFQKHVSCLLSPVSKSTFTATYMVEKEMTTHTSILAWEIPWTEEPGRLQCPGFAKRQTQLRD